MRLWRVFPWDPDVSAGEPFSASHLPAQSGHGRFDLSRAMGASTWYFAESPDHAIAERIQDLRNRPLPDEALFEFGRPLALVSVSALPSTPPIDLCDPAVLADRGIAPDRLAYRDRAVTRVIAAGLHAGTRVVGLRWWSAFFGEWHTVALFSDRLGEGDLSFGEPEPLHRDMPALVEAARALAIDLGGV